MTTSTGTDSPRRRRTRGDVARGAVELGGKLDGVDIVFKETRWPVAGTKAEKRAERAVAYLAAAGRPFGLALLLIFLFWPWEYKPDGCERRVWSTTWPPRCTA